MTDSQITAQTTETSAKAGVLETQWMDTSIRPQDDFFRFVNGYWLETHQIPADRAADGSFRKLDDQAQDRSRSLVEELAASSHQDPDGQRIATLFSQFMDVDTVNQAGGQPLVEIVNQLKAVTSHEDLARLLGELQRGPIASFFTCYVNADINNTQHNLLYFTQAGLGLPDESYYRKDEYAEIRTQYVEHVAHLFQLIGTRQDEARTHADEVMAFETSLATHHWDQVKLRDPQAQNNPQTFKQAAQSAPGFAWKQWVLGFYPELETLDHINVDQPDYLTAAAQLWAETDLQVLVWWRIRALVDSYASLLSDDFVAEHFNFYSKTLSGQQELKPRWKRGLGLVEGVLGEALGRLYVARFFPPESKEQMDNLVRHLLDAYHDSIESLDWMGEDTKKRALEKLSTFNPKIGYPKTWRDYTALDISANKTLIDNVRACERFETEYELSKLGKPVDRDEWLMTPQTVNAYYNPTMNEIVFPAAILESPFFDPQVDSAVNYGAIGAVIGHEIGHGFDDQGSQFDAHGNLKNWWTDQDRSEFEKRTQALIDQYDAFVPKQLEGLEGDYHVQGALTIGENIGDLGGLTIAWKAWCATLKEDGIDDPHDAPLIDGLTGPQRFFYSWARIWREKRHQELAIQYLAIDPHSPTEFRCNGVLRNCDQFAETFDVHSGDDMWLEPDQRVRIW